MVFSVFIIIVLWITQTFLLNSLYSFYAKTVVKQQAEVIEENIDNPNLDVLLISVSQENSFSVYLMSEDGTVKTASERSPNIRINQALPIAYEYWALASENGGTYITDYLPLNVVTDGGDAIEYDPSNFTGNVPQEVSSQYIIYSSEIFSSDGEDFLLLIMSKVSPPAHLDDGLYTILIITSIFSLSVSMIFAFIASKGLASPIKELSNAAGKLASGDYDTFFSGGGCLETVRLGKTLNAAATKLRKTESLRRELIANVSHDLRTPLTMIAGYGEMMRDIPGENNAENIQIIIDETKRLTNLVNSALDLSKLDSGIYNLRPSVFSLTDEVYDIVSQFEKLSAGKSKITFIHSGEVFVNADETLISEAIYNLLSNAVNHSGDASSVVVRQNIIDSRVKISVIDNGRGIPPELLDDLWDRYQKGTDSGIGTGLGLAIVKSAVTLCSGTYGVMSTVGHGSEFWIELPVYKE